MDKFLKAAIDEAKQGYSEGGIPIGSVLVRNDKIIGRGHNKRVQEQDPVAHAEIDCLRNAGRIGNYKGATLYSTLMPCHLCTGAIIQFGIKRVVAGENRTFPGDEELLKQHGVEVINLDNSECYELMQTFIREKPALWAEDIGEL